MNKSTIKILMIGASLTQNGGIATLEKLMLKYPPAKVEIQHITSHDEGSIAYRIMIFVKAWVKFVWRLLITEIDIVHIHISDGASLFRKAILAVTAFIFQKPVVMHANGAEFHVTYAQLPNWIQQFMKNIFRRCDAFIAVTSFWQNYYLSNLGLDEEKLFIVPNPTVLPEKIPNREYRNEVNFVFCGRIGQRKGAFDLINAFSKMPNSARQNAKLILAGDGEIDRGMELVKQLDLTNKITFLGWINEQKRDELLAEGDVFVLPSYNEGLPLALMEAMGWGLAVITTPSSGISDVVTTGKNGILVNPGDIQQLSEAIQLLIADKKLRLELGSAARKTVDSFDINKFDGKLLDIYQSIL
jgi:glycosyltransferase involved in cell wall biosynthesis